MGKLVTKGIVPAFLCLLVLTLSLDGFAQGKGGGGGKGGGRGSGGGGNSRRRRALAPAMEAVFGTHAGAYDVGAAPDAEDERLDAGDAESGGIGGGLHERGEGRRGKGHGTAESSTRPSHI